jgi:acetate kinase
MKVLVLNAGSSSLKFRLTEIEASRAPARELTRGIVERTRVWSRRS